MKGKLILEDGTIFEGKAFGYLGDSIGEEMCIRDSYNTCKYKKGDDNYGCKGIHKK